MAAAESFIYGWPSEEVGHLATASMTTGTAASGYPASLICNWTIGNETKPALAAANGAATWQLAFGGSPAQQIIEWVVIWHNFLAGITLHFQGSDDNFATTPLDVTTTVPARLQDGFHQKIHLDLRLVIGSGFSAYRLVVPAATVPAGVKLLCYSQARQLDCNMSAEPRMPLSERALVHPTDYNFKWVYRLYSATEDLAATALPSPQDLEDLRAWFRDCVGVGLVTALAFDPDDPKALIVRWKPNGTSGLVTTTLDPTLFIQHAQMHSVRLEFEELTSGLPEWT